MVREFNPLSALCQQAAIRSTTEVSGRETNEGRTFVMLDTQGIWFIICIPLDRLLAVANCDRSWCRWDTDYKQMPTTVRRRAILSNQSVKEAAEDVAEAFNRNGFLIASGLYSTDEMLDWKARIIGILEAGGHISTEPTSTGIHVFMADVPPSRPGRMTKDARVSSDAAVDPSSAWRPPLDDRFGARGKATWADRNVRPTLNADSSG